MRDPHQASRFAARDPHQASRFATRDPCGNLANSCEKISTYRVVRRQGVLVGGGTGPLPNHRSRTAPDPPRASCVSQTASAKEAFTSQGPSLASSPTCSPGERVAAPTSATEGEHSLSLSHTRNLSLFLSLSRAFSLSHTHTHTHTSNLQLSLAPAAPFPDALSMYLVEGSGFRV